ncbi:MAG TPA: hypothetical protein VF834_15255 [Streptosporangiaceae bacterium]
MPATTKNGAAKAASTAWDHTRQARDHVKLAAAQMKPAARSSREAAARGSRKAQAWAVQQAGHARVRTAALLRSAAQRIESGSGRPGRRRRDSGGDA